MPRIQNFTPTRIGNGVARDVLAFVCPPGVTGTVAIKRANGYGYRGLAHTSRNYVTVWIGDESRFPCRGTDKRKLRAQLRQWRKVPATTSYAHWYGQDGKIVRVTERMRRPAKPGPGNGYLPRPALGNQIEAFVYVLAHELRHLWQARVPRGRRVWGARSQFSERDADAYALRMLRAWRRREIASPTQERVA